MPVKNYGVLKGQVVGYTPPDDKDSTPHFTVNISDNNNREYEIIINVKSKKVHLNYCIMRVKIFILSKLQTYLT